MARNSALFLKMFEISQCCMRPLLFFFIIGMDFGLERTLSNNTESAKMDPNFKNFDFAKISRFAVFLKFLFGLLYGLWQRNLHVSTVFHVLYFVLATKPTCFYCFWFSSFHMVVGNKTCIFPRLFHIL